LRDLRRGDEALTLLRRQACTSREQSNFNRLQAAWQIKRSCYHRADPPDDRDAYRREALALHREEERICRQLGNLDALQTNLGNQGVILTELGQLQEALTLQRQKEQICRRLGNAAGLARALANQALVARLNDDLLEATRLLEQAQAIASGAGLARLVGEERQLAT
jgi:hypothetical protein